MSAGPEPSIVGSLTVGPECTACGTNQLPERDYGTDNPAIPADTVTGTEAIIAVGVDPDQE